MRISVNWLKELVEFDLSPVALADALTMAGFEVEEIEDRQSWAAGVVVGRVVARQPHPDAEKLSVCTVDIGASENSTIVCGAANVGANMCVPVATVGSYLPKVDLTIKPRELRGVPSNGMICSLSELGLAKESEGIYIFDEASFARQEIVVGQDVRPLLGLNDFVLDVTSTANRADALSMVGIAREISAITGNPLKLPTASKVAGTQGLPAGISIALTEPKACPIYIGSVLENVQIGPSPAWLQQRLGAAGTRAINNVVDVTNYVLLEWGQPLHAFDLDRLIAASKSPSVEIGVRFAKADEVLVTLDDQSRHLGDQTLLITANDMPVALAGVMGGAESEVVTSTQTVFLEAAYFDAAVIRKSARSQGLRTEASARYERGVNPAELSLACDRALSLLQQIAGATLVGQSEDCTEIGHIPFTREVSLRLSRINQILGRVVTAEGITTMLDQSTVEALLAKLGCQAALTSGKGGETNEGNDDLAAPASAISWTVTIPPYRYRDLEREIDLIEEIARLYGYDRFDNTLPSQTSRGYLSEEAALSRQLRAAFRAAGLTETLHYSLTNTTSEKQVVLANPLFKEYSALRIDLIEGLLDAFKLNLDNGNGPLNAFEIGNVFNKSADNPDGDPIESLKVAGIIGGDARRGRWVNSNQMRPMTWFEAKGTLQRVFDSLGLAVDYRAAGDDDRLHPGRTASLWVRGRTDLGKFGQIHPQLCQQRDLPEAVYVFELNWSVLVTCLTGKSGQAVTFANYSTYPASDRDLAFFAPVEVSVADLQKVMSKSGGKLLDSVMLFDEYRGDTVPEGQRSLAFRLVYRAGDRTLTDKDIDPVHQKVRASLEKTYRVSLRS